MCRDGCGLGETSGRRVGARQVQGCDAVVRTALSRAVRTLLSMLAVTTTPSITRLLFGDLLLEMGRPLLDVGLRMRL